MFQSNGLQYIVHDSRPETGIDNPGLQSDNPGPQSDSAGPQSDHSGPQSDSTGPQSDSADTQFRVTYMYGATSFDPIEVNSPSVVSKYCIDLPNASVRFCNILHKSNRVIVGSLTLRSVHL